MVKTQVIICAKYTCKLLLSYVTSRHAQVVQLDIYISCFKCCTFHTLFFLLMLSEDLLPFGFPSIDMGPQLKVVERTRTATMLCAASGIPDPEISWFKDFLPVDPSTSQGRIKQLRSGETGDF